ncbi:MAG: hypothetical protein J5626_10650 [Lachnospiraceae bacterium]|nr:hypothetical protein [Lachnospiraceae bacterium]
MKRSLFMVTALVLVLALTGCGESAPVASKPVKTETQSVAETAEKSVEKAETAQKEEVSEPAASVESDSKETTQDAGNSDADKPAEYSTASKLWRVYKMDDPESSIEKYLYLDINLSKGYVEIYHNYYAENTFSSMPWPASDGIIDVKEYNGAGGPPAIWQVYLEYSESVIKLYQVNDDGTVDREYCDVFYFESEDVLN